MLNRALLEEALDVHWVAATPDIAPGYADDHDRMVALAEREMEVRFGRPAELTAEQRSELKALRKRYANFRAPWTLVTDATRIALIKHRGERRRRAKSNYVYEVIQRQNNVLLHSSPTSYGLAMSAGRRQINRIGPDPRWREALAHGVLGYYLIARVLAELHISTVIER